MPVSISQLVTDTASVALTVGEDAIRLVYAPLKISAATMAEMASLDDRSGLDRLNGVVHLVHDLLSSWDLVEEDGATVVALTEDRLSHLPISFLMRVLTAIFDDIRMGEASGATPK